MQTSSLTFKTIQNLLSTAIIAGGIASCNTNIENRGMNKEEEEQEAAWMIEEQIKNPNLNDDWLKNLLRIKGNLQDPNRAKITRHIEMLYLKSSELTERSADILRTSNLNSLKFLSLKNTKIGNKGCKNLSKLKAPELYMLTLFSCGISSQGVAHLVKAQWKLKSLIVTNNYLNIEAIKNLPSATFNLEYLGLDSKSNLDYYYTSIALIMFNNSDLKWLSLKTPYDMKDPNEMEYVKCIKEKFPGIEIEGF